MRRLHILALSIFLAWIAVSAVYAQAPGGVSTGLAAWYKGDAGLSATFWEDQSGNAYDLSRTSAPITDGTFINFNPIASFTGVTVNQFGNAGPKLLWPVGNTTPTTYYYVAKNNVAIANRAVFGIGTSGANTGFHSGQTGSSGFIASAGATALTTGSATATVVSPPNWDISQPNRGLNLVRTGFDGGGTAGRNYIAAQGGVEVTNSTNVNPTYANTAAFRIGSSGANSVFWSGDIAEVVVFSGKHNPADYNKVETYLALKYGITKQGDYIDANSNIVYSDVTYNNDIAGIGRDDASGLHQKQSMSQNAGSQLLIGNGNSLFDANTANTNNLTDRQFLVWGDNGLNKKLTETFIHSAPGGEVNARFAAVWKVQNVNFAGVVTVAWPTGIADLHLIRSADVTIDATDDFIPMTGITTVNGIDYNTATITFNDGDYFTLAGYQFSPGGVAADLVVWHRADVGLGLSGTAVTTWDDISPNRLQVGQMGTAALPSFGGAATTFNFNPSVDFTATNQVLGQRTGTTLTTNMYDVFHVFGDEMSGGTVFFGIGRNNITNDGNNWDSPHFMVADNIRHRNESGGGLISLNPTPAYSAVAPISRIAHARFNVGALSRSINGSIFGSTVSLGTGNNTAWVKGGHYFGANNATGSGMGGDDAGFTGQITETIIFDRNLTDDEKDRIDSYLGIKYGITLRSDIPLSGNHSGTFDYKASTGSIVWSGTSNPDYHNNVFGIAHDLPSGLQQKQSKSGNPDQKLIIGNGSSLFDTNTANTNDLTEGQFLIVGDNGLPQSFGTAINDPEVNIRFDAIWKVQNTNGVGQVTIAWPKTENLHLVRSVGNDTFDASDDFYGMTDEVTINGTAYNTVVVTLNDGDYFTFAGFAYAPGGVTGPDFWVKSDDAGDIATAWKDHSINGDDIPAVGAWTVSPPDGNHNFHPYTTGYTNSRNFYNPASVMNPNGNAEGPIANYTIFSAIRPTTFSEGRITGLDNDANYAAEPGVSITNAGLPRHYEYWATTTATNFSTAYSLNTTNVFSVLATNGAVNGGSSSNAGGEKRLGLNGTYEITDNFSSGNRFQLWGNRLNVGYGSWDSGGPFPGDIMEVVWYNRELTVDEQSRVNAYLAIKNGVTLNEDYFSATADIVWNRATNNLYNNNIFGLGRNNISPLHQKQARSTNANQKLVIGNGSALFDTNLANTNALTEGQFLMTGDNGLAQSLSVPLAYVGGANGTTNYRFAAIWKVQNTASVGTVTIAWPEGISNLYLVQSADNTFDASDQFIPMSAQTTINGVVYNTATVTLADGGYFTFAGFAHAPGGVVNNLSYWYRADKNTDHTGIGTDVTSWADYFANTVASEVGGNDLPTFKDGDESYFNFNPGINFTSINQTIGTRSVQTVTNANNDLFTVTKEGMTYPGSPNPHFFSIGMDNVTTTIDNWDYLGLWPSNNVERRVYQGGTGFPSVNPAHDNNITSIMYYNFLDRPYSRGLNGAANGNTYNAPGVMGIALGGHIFGSTRWTGSGSDNGGFIGNIAETIIYGQGNITPTERRKVDSYLAIKYGITLGRVATDHYLSSTETVIWNGAENTVYNNNIFGMGRDDISGFEQKVSNSVNSGTILTISKNNDFASSNLDARTSFTDDLTYLIFGDNNVTTTPTNTLTLPGGLGVTDMAVISRKWLSQRTLATGDIYFQADLSDYGVAFTVSSNEIYMLVADDDAFTQNVQLAAGTYTGGKWVFSHNFDSEDNNRYVTFGYNDEPVIGNPFLCTDMMYIAQSSDGTTTTLYSINTSTNPLSYDPIGATSDVLYNAMGLRAADGFIYALLDGSNQLLKISADGTYVNLGAVTGLPVPATAYNNAEMDDSDNFYVMSTNFGSPATNMYNIDIATLTATAIPLTAPSDPSDFAYNVNTGLLYGVNNGGRLISINPANGVVTLIGTATGGQPFGAMMGSSTGEVYGVSNNGGFYQFNLNNGTRVLISSSPTSSGNEGAHCVNAPITFEADLAITKTDGMGTYAAGTSTTYTIVVTNNGPFGVLGARVTDAVPVGVPTANMSYTAVASSESTTTVTGTQIGAIDDLVALPVNGTITYTVTVSIPASFTGNLVNSASVTMPESATDSNLKDNYATDINIPECYGPDSDGDGIPDMCDMDDDNDGILDINECAVTYSPIIVANTELGNLIEYNSITNTVSTLCTGITTSGIVGDIAMDSNGDIWGVTSSNALVRIDPTDCSITEIIADLGFSGNGLSFMPDGNLLVGGGSNTSIRKIDIAGGTNTITTWHDFTSGHSNGDFIFLGGKVYVLWFDSGIDASNPILLEVEVDANFNYVSHAVLGTLPRYTWGLSKVNGNQLYGVTGVGTDGAPNPEGTIVKINISPFSWETTSTYPEKFYGATSLDEGVLECDTDKDGIPDRLDLDSDGDGCPDALEGDGNFDLSELTIASGTIASQSPNQNFGIAVDANGIPMTVGATGQGVGQSQDNTKNDCLDTDGDGIPDWLDLDSDNDGILDTDECGAIDQVSNGTFPTSGDNTDAVPGWTVGGTYNGGWGSSIGRVNLNSNGLEFRRDDGTVTTLEQDLTNVLGNAVTINLNDLYWVKTYVTGSDSQFLLTVSYGGVVYATIDGTDSNAPSVVANNGASVNLSTLPAVIATPAQNSPIQSAKTNLSITLPGDIPTSGTLLVTFIAGTEPTEVKDVGMRSIAVLACGDTDGDGIPDYLDLDSDNDGCPDALEGDENVILADLNPDGSINVGANGGVDSYGVPNLVNTGGGADDGDDQGQGIGSAQDPLTNTCTTYCVQPGATGTPTVFTQVGVSDREGFGSGWPESVPNGFIAIESETSGFVITRVQQVSDIADPQEGMLVYEIADQCVKLYNGTTWNCIQRSCNE